MTPSSVKKFLEFGVDFSIYYLTATEREAGIDEKCLSEQNYIANTIYRTSTYKIMSPITLMI